MEHRSPGARVQGRGLQDKNHTAPPSLSMAAGHGRTPRRYWISEPIRPQRTSVSQGSAWARSYWNE